MKKIIITVCAIFALAGCGVDTDKTIEYSKKCENSGMRSTYKVNFFGGVEIICLAKY